MRRDVPRSAAKVPVKPVAHGNGHKSLAAKKPVAAAKSAAAHEDKDAVGVGANNGKDRRQQEAEFEEF